MVIVHLQSHGVYLHIFIKIDVDVSWVKMCKIEYFLHFTHFCNHWCGCCKSETIKYKAWYHTKMRGSNNKLFNSMPKKKREKTTIQQIQRIKDQKRKKKNEANSNRYVDFSKNWGSTTHIPPYRVKGPKSIYIRPWPRTLSGPRTYKQYQRCKARCPMSKLQMKGLGRVCRGGISLWLNEAKIKTCVLPSMVTFQEVLLIRTCIMNVQEEWELKNI